jgi:hypothetical protein
MVACVCPSRRSTSHAAAVLESIDDKVLGRTITVFPSKYFDPKYRFPQVEDSGSVSWLT